MSTLVLKMSMSLDGFIAGPDGEMDWAMAARSDDSTAWVLRTLQEADVHLIGRGFHDGVAAFWSSAQGPMAAAMNDTPKVVASHSLSAEAAPPPGGLPFAGAGTWESPYLAGGDLVTDVERLKEHTAGVVLVNGGVRFARSLVSLGLVDEYRLVIAPIALGRGQPLFSDLTQPLDLDLIDTAVFDGGIVAQTLVPKTTA